MLERNGAKIDTDEIDFENQYQIVIRIDKNNFFINYLLTLFII